MQRTGDSIGSWLGGPGGGSAAAAAERGVLGQSLSVCVHGVAWLYWLAFSLSEN
jgi:hypothetical protein